LDYLKCYWLGKTRHPEPEGETREGGLEILPMGGGEGRPNDIEMQKDNDELRECLDAKGRERE